MRRSWMLIPVLALAGCGTKEGMAYFGRWSGRFAVESAEGSSEGDRLRSGMKGYLQIYATERRFKMHLEGEQQNVDVSGHWEIKKRRLTLRSNDIQIEDPGEELSDPTRKRLPPRALRDAYARPLVFDLSPDGRALTGLTTSVGTLVGRHLFTKGQ